MSWNPFTSDPVWVTDQKACGIDMEQDCIVSQPLQGSLEEINAILMCFQTQQTMHLKSWLTQIREVLYHQIEVRSKSISIPDHQRACLYEIQVVAVSKVRFLWRLFIHTVVEFQCHQIYTNSLRSDFALQIL